MGGEVILLDAAQPKSATKRCADYKTVLRIQNAEPPRLRRRRHADVTFGSSLKAHGPIRIVDSPRIINRLLQDGYLKHEAKVQWNHRRANVFHLIVCWPVDLPPPLPNSGRVVSLDPGARRFQVWYDPADGSHGELLGEWNGTSGTKALDERLAQYNTRAARRKKPPWKSDNGVEPIQLPSMTGRKARAERARVAQNQRTDPEHRRWLVDRWRTAIRNRRAAYHRACDSTKDWRRHAHYDAIGFLLTVHPTGRIV